MTYRLHSIIACHFDWCGLPSPSQHYCVAFQLTWLTAYCMPNYSIVFFFYFELYYRIAFQQMWNFVHHFDWHDLPHMISTYIIVCYFDIHEIPDICRVSCRLTCHWHAWQQVRCGHFEIHYRISCQLLIINTYDFDLQYHILCRHTWNTGYLLCFMSIDMPDSRWDTVILTYLIVYRFNYCDSHDLPHMISTYIIVCYFDIHEIPDICCVSCRLTCLTAGEMRSFWNTLSYIFSIISSDVSSVTSVDYFDVTHTHVIS